MASSGADASDAAAAEVFAVASPYLTPYLPAPVVALLLGKHSIAFVLSIAASLGTFAGGVLVVVLVRLLGASPTSRSTSVLIGVLQAFSAGVMLYMTFVDLLPESAAAVGGREAMVWFFAGVVVFAGLEQIVEAMEVAGGSGHGHSHGGGGEGHGHSHGPGQEDHVHGTEPVPAEEKTAKKASGKKEAIGDDEKTNERASPGASSDAAQGESEATKGQESLSAEARKQLIRTSLITFYALLLHNMPEGLGVFLSALSDVRLGLQLTVAILLHNVPEGMAVAIPLYAAGDNSLGHMFYVLRMTLLNGLAEPLGVLLGVGILGPFGLLTPENLSRCLAAVGGIMACISLHELLPTAIRLAGQNRATISLFSGMAVVFFALEAVGEVFGHAHGHGGHGHGHGGSDVGHAHGGGSAGHDHAGHVHHDHHHHHKHDENDAARPAAVEDDSTVVMGDKSSLKVEVPEQVMRMVKQKQQQAQAEDVDDEGQPKKQTKPKKKKPSASSGHGGHSHGHSHGGGSGQHSHHH
ncbi:ZIP zinc transporter-domain-containing protein [Zopfochytrium polystomum]|nr:ZIP zinc transporter-domain-containing protein [Zopfochytrium polystomum]